MLLSSHWITEEIKDEIKKKKYLKTSENEITIVQNLWDVAKAVLRGKFIAIQSYLGLPIWCRGKKSAYQCRRHGFSPWVGKIPGSRKCIHFHSSILAWEIPWTEEPGGPQSMGFQRVGHD